jgi:cytochrome c oxidase subunit 3
MKTMTVMNEERETREKVAQPLLWIGIVSMVMFFGAFTSAYIVSRGKSNWMVFELPRMFYISTAVILASSVTMNWAVSMAKKNRFDKFRTPVLITMLLGVLFVFTQFLGFKELIANNIYFVGPTSGSYVYLIVLLHFLHLFGGLIALIIIYFRAGSGAYSSDNMLGVKLGAIFWHFLDVLWILLFLFLFFVR